MKKTFITAVIAVSMISLTACEVVQQTLTAVAQEALTPTTSLGQVQQADPSFPVTVTSCRRQGNDVILTFQVRNNTGQTLQDVRIGNIGYAFTSYPVSMEGKTDVGQIFDGASSRVKVQGGNWDSIARFDMPAGGSKTIQVGVTNIASNARSISLQVGFSCQNKTFDHPGVVFTLVPIQ